jgi:hypothetical protein
MADSILSVTVRDAPFPCAPYQATNNSFRLQIFHCDGRPLFWRGEDFGKAVPSTSKAPGAVGSTARSGCRRAATWFEHSVAARTQ